MTAAIDERTPLKRQSKNQQQHTNFADTRWFVALLVSTIFLALSGFLLDKRHAWDRQIQSNEKPIAEAPQQLEKTGAIAAKPKSVVRSEPKAEVVVKAPPVTTTEAPLEDMMPYFLKCNPSVIPMTSVSVRGGGAFEKADHSKTPLDGDKCTSEEVAVIRGMLDTHKFNYQATVPTPYLYPANVLQALLGMDLQTMHTALGSYEKKAQKMGNLGSLVKLFVWGLPMHAKELWAAGGDDVVEALNRCNMIRKCGDESVYTSAVQLFAVEDTSVIVASDWPVAGLSLRKDELQVPVVDQHTLALAHNMPDSQGARVVDVASNGGLLGLMAADKGAKEVITIQTDPRGQQFAQFNTWLNLASSQVQVHQNDFQRNDYNKYELSRILGKDLYLVMAHPTGPQKDLILQAALDIARPLLSAKGSIVMALEDRHCESFAQDNAKELCSRDGTGAFIGLAGNVVCRTDKNMADGGDDNSQEGIIYGWQASLKEEAFLQKGDKRMCGDFQVRHLQKFDNGGAEACQYARAEMQCTQPEYKVNAMLDEMLGKR